MHMQIYCDGGSRGNPGPAAAAFVVFEDGREVFSKSDYLGITTNNIAEYHAAIGALQWLQKLSSSNTKKIEIFFDSELVSKQLKGEYKIKKNHLKLLAAKAKNIERLLPFKIEYKAIPRNKNRRADELVNKVLDENS